jgi:hypothetical protein
MPITGSLPDSRPLGYQHAFGGVDALIGLIFCIALVILCVPFAMTIIVAGVYVVVGIAIAALAFAAVAIPLYLIAGILIEVFHLPMKDSTFITLMLLQAVFYVPLFLLAREFWRLPGRVPE